MATQVTNYQCPACMGPLRFVGSSGRLECEHCSSSHTVAEIEALYSKKEEKAEKTHAAAEEKAARSDGWDTSELGGDWGADAAGMKAYSCPSCGAELICDATTAATSCPYCGNPSIVPGQFGGVLKPDFVVPFKLDKKAAMAALENHYKGKKFLPNSFVSGNHIQEIKGIYVPFWLFDGVADADVSFDATKSRKHRSGDEEITTTDHFRIRRCGTVTFEKIPVDASTKMPDAHMDSIEPFDYEALQPFSTAYLPGYLAEKYDVSVEDSAKRADDRATRSARDSMSEDVHGYNSCSVSRENIQLERGAVSYALMPVWLLCTKWEGKDYLFAMNGQTGRLIGDLPISRGKAFAWFAGIAIPLAAILSAILLL